MKIALFRIFSLSKSLNQTLTKVLAIILVFVFVGLSIPAKALAQIEPAKYVRREAHSPDAATDIESLKIALTKMRELGCDNPLSWYYQGGIHWVPTGETQLRYLETNPLCSSYNQTMDELKVAWDNCTHSNAPTSDPNFLVWHRFFVYHFENVVRVLSGNKNFALPYWGYVNLDSTEENPGDISLTMPKAFIEPAKGENSLYEDGRFSKLLAGEAIEAQFAQKSLFNAVEDLNKDISFADFNERIDGKPHGQMHNYIGTGLGTGAPDPDPPTKFNKIFNGVFDGQTDGEGYGLMTNVPSAGFDPIFWMHHGNIDRLWEQWTNSPNGKYVTLEDLRVEGQPDWPYKFFEAQVKADGTIGSTEVNYTLEDVINQVYNLGYEYDDTPMVTPPTEQLLVEVERSFMSPQRVSQEVGKLVDANTSLDLQVPIDPQMGTSLRLFQFRNLIPTETKGYVLEIDVTYTGRPYSSYDVFLNVPDEQSRSDINTYYAGSISFFVIPSAEPVTKTFRFDVTDELFLQLRKLQEEMNTETVSVSIRKENGPEDESIQVERVQLSSY